MLVRVWVALLLAFSWPSPALSQQRPCTAVAHVVVLDPSSFANQAAAEWALSFLKSWTSGWVSPYGADRNDKVFGCAIPGSEVSVALWAPAHGLPLQPFAPHDEHRPIAVLSADVDRGPRRIIFVVENGKQVTPSARQVGAAGLTTILSHARPEDSFALLTAGGLRVAVPFGSSPDSLRAAIAQLWRPRPAGAQSGNLADALLEAATWFGSPQAGDSVFLVARRIAGGRAHRVRSALAAGRIRLFTLGVGTLIHSATDAGFWETPLLELSEESGGGWEQVEDLPRKGDATDAQFELSRKEALDLYGMVETIYVIQLERTGPHVMIEPSQQVIDEMPWARVAYQRPLPVCPPPAGTAPAEGKKKK